MCDSERIRARERGGGLIADFDDVGRAARSLARPGAFALPVRAGLWVFVGQHGQPQRGIGRVKRRVPPSRSSPRSASGPSPSTISGSASPSASPGRSQSGRRTRTSADAATAAEFDDALRMRESALAGGP